MYAFIESVNIISTDQKLMCLTQFPSLLVYLTISNSAFKSNYNKVLLASDHCELQDVWQTVGPY